MNIPIKMFRRAAIVLLYVEQLLPGIFIMKTAYGVRLALAGTASLFITVLLTQGCDKNTLGIVDPIGASPILIQASVSPDSVYLDGIPQTSGKYAVTVLLTASVTDSNGSGIQVFASLFRPSETDPYLQVQLHDDGLAPDAVAMDGRFSGSAQITLSRSQAGFHRIQVWAIDEKNHRSNQSNLTLRFSLKNSLPFIGAPSIRSTAPSDSMYISFFVPVSDSNGLQSISSVSVHVLNAVDTSRHRLFDDGLASHSDFFPGDGTFSGSLSVRPTGLPDSLSFVFTAIDDQGAQATFVKSYHVNRPPSFVALNIPSSIIRPTSGSIFVYFFATVTDPDGLADIDSVYFRNFSSTTPSNILMYDDGNLAVHGDSTAGDGTYSRILTIDPTNSPGQKEFHFYVVDKAGAVDTLIRTITIY